MNSTHYPQHPFSRGYFATVSEELRAARGKPSSRDFEKQARKMDDHANAARHAAISFDRLLAELERAEARALAEAPELREHIEANADEEQRRLHKEKAERLDVAQLHQKRADEQRQLAEQARAFEARFDFNPYKDPLRDAVEKRNAQVLAEREEKRRKAQERKSQSRARR